MKTIVILSALALPVTASAQHSPVTVYETILDICTVYPSVNTDGFRPLSQGWVYNYVAKHRETVFLVLADYSGNIFEKTFFRFTPKKIYFTGATPAILKVVAENEVKAYRAENGCPTDPTPPSAPSVVH